MVILIAGDTHTGKTLLAQKLLEIYHFPYLSIDHLKMGLIRSKQTNLTIEDDEELTNYLWNIIKEMIKTVIENNQNLIIEGCYIPFDWKKDFKEMELKRIRYVCLIMSEHYIDTHAREIKQYENRIEQRIQDIPLDIDTQKKQNKYNLAMCRKYNLAYIWIDDAYKVDLDFLQGVDIDEYS